MDVLLGAIGWLVVELIFYGLFYAIGWAVIKAITLGRHPGPWRGLESVVDAEYVALAGLLFTIAAIALTFWWATH
ncbi:hypothetical protein [Cupriavidus sp. RAF12]|jgi:hypothetical protein|uniref:hypothetical protein n=1 Tax=Cupriavidus sp. RAF12 TaxID=3233050 RepID=UPI003F918E9F